MWRRPARAQTTASQGAGRPRIVAALNTREMAAQFALYHRLPPAPAPAAAAQHRGRLRAACSTSTRRSARWQRTRRCCTALGLVFPVELPDAVCPPSPAAGSYLSLTVTDVTPGWQWSDPPDLGQVPTPHTRDPDTSFAAAPATDPASLASGTIAGGDVIDGFLALTRRDFTLVEVDLDGALLKAMALADSVAFAEIRDGDRAGPARRCGRRASRCSPTGAPSSCCRRSGTTNRSRPRSRAAPRRARSTRATCCAATVSTSGPLASARWLSLHRRDGTYRFGSEGTVSLTVTDEEGFTQLAVMQPADDPTRPDDSGGHRGGRAAAGHRPVRARAGRAVERLEPVRAAAGPPLNRSPDPALAADPTRTTAPRSPRSRWPRGSPRTPARCRRCGSGTGTGCASAAVDLAGHSVTPDTHGRRPVRHPAAGHHAAVPAATSR